ncbi:unnamed protein product [Sordaria macrospora k-hell]|uniref:WGS project CABT00000000 data, contig 2.18 n=1 Tax=Sordaria macrospora (strain ATCC MYA-333 / DSM 997 / K(L3346) / K-hell) TaxID=771870 RepID=F7W115_SORMK|nr:uncharacterized protein SMAC_02124 [Sordaria macrospora k-hell]CCC11467.1 unnamed protein product [Sordaria macrospora k-hell]
MSLKQEIETWVSALTQYDNSEFDAALQEFEKIADTSKILFNMGVIHATLGQHEQAVECYQRAIRLDQYLAVAYFQQGVSNFLLGDFEEALANFNDTLLYLRGNQVIDYAQLGLLFKLYSCEVLFNRGLCYIYLQQTEAGMQDLAYAAKEKVVEDHNVIDEAIKENAEGYTVFSIPVGVVYRPNEAKAGKLEVKDDRPAESLSFAATNLVKPGLQSRRQQSEPPTNRSMFPPTPPPENEKSQMSRGASVRNGPKPMPAKLNLDKVRPSDRYEKTSPEEPPRRPSRAASATPSRGFSQRDQQPPPRMRRNQQEEEDSYAGDLYDMSQRGTPAPRYIQEEDEESDYDVSFDEGEFEMVSGRRPSSNTVRSSGGRGSSRRPELRTIRVKVHAGDVRYIMVGTAIEFPDFEEKIRSKFGIRRRIKIKIKDDDSPEGDMITVGDQDDLDMLIQTVKQNARKQKLETGKMEVWVQEI